jgi:hypothetical protein
LRRAGARVLPGVETTISEEVEQLGEPSFIKIADRRFTVGPNPFWMLGARRLMDLHLEFGEGSNSVSHTQVYSVESSSCFRFARPAWIGWSPRR